MTYFDENLAVVISRINKNKESFLTTNNIDQANIKISKTLLNIRDNNFSPSIIVKNVGKYVEENVDDTDINLWLKEMVNRNYTDEYDHMILKTIPKFLYKTEVEEIKRKHIKKVVKEIPIENMFDIHDLHRIQRLINPSSLYERAYILLDTSLASDILSDATRFKWNFLPNTILQSGAVNTYADVKNLIGMRIFPIQTQLASTRTPNFTDPPTDFTLPIGLIASGVVPTFSNDIINKHNYFTVFIEEFGSQAYVGREGRKFHFTLFPVLMNPIEVDDIGKAVPRDDPYYELVTSGRGNGWFWFNKPITTFSTLTISLADPIDPFPLSQNIRTLIPLEFTFLKSYDTH